MMWKKNSTMIKLLQVAFNPKLIYENIFYPQWKFGSDNKWKLIFELFSLIAAQIKFQGILNRVRFLT